MKGVFTWTAQNFSYFTQQAHNWIKEKLPDSSLYIRSPGQWANQKIDSVKYAFTKTIVQGAYVASVLYQSADDVYEKMIQTWEGIAINFNPEVVTFYLRSQKARNAAKVSLVTNGIFYGWALLSSEMIKYTFDIKEDDMTKNNIMVNTICWASGRYFGRQLNGLNNVLFNSYISGVASKEVSPRAFQYTCDEPEIDIFVSDLASGVFFATDLAFIYLMDCLLSLGPVTDFAVELYLILLFGRSLTEYRLKQCMKHSNEVLAENFWVSVGQGLFHRGSAKILTESLYWFTGFRNAYLKNLLLDLAYQHGIIASYLNNAPLPGKKKTSFDPFYLNHLAIEFIAEKVSSKALPYIKQLQNDRCSFVRMTTNLPKDHSELLKETNAAYVFASDGLYYINKKDESCINLKVEDTSAEKLKIFQKEFKKILNLSSLTKHVSIPKLSRKQLAFFEINFNHKHQTQLEKFILMVNDSPIFQLIKFISIDDTFSSLKMFVRKPAVDSWVSLNRDAIQKAINEIRQKREEFTSHLVRHLPANWLPAKYKTSRVVLDLIMEEKMVDILDGLEDALKFHHQYQLEKEGNRISRKIYDPNALKQLTDDQTYAAKEESPTPVIPNSTTILLLKMGATKTEEAQLDVPVILPSSSNLNKASEIEEFYPLPTKAPISTIEDDMFYNTPEQKTKPYRRFRSKSIKDDYIPKEQISVVSAVQEPVAPKTQAPVPSEVGAFSVVGSWKVPKPSQTVSKQPTEQSQPKTARGPH